MTPTQYNSTSAPRSVPLIVGAIYQLIPSMGGQYVMLTKVDRRYAYAVGYENNFADIKVRKYRWPEIIIKLVGRPEGFPALRLSAQDGYVLLLSGGRIALTTGETNG